MKKLLVLDGPMGTELERRGYDISDNLWSARLLAEDPDAIEQIHRDYLEAGADIVTCASYQATIPGFLKAGYTESEAGCLIRKSMEIAEHARKTWWNKRKTALAGRPWPLIAGDIGPYGAYLANGSEYTGNYHLSRDGYISFHLRRMEILKEAGADLFAVETCPKLEEAVVCAELLEDLGADYWISFTFRSENEISDGTPASEVAEALKDYPHLQCVGVNCVSPDLVDGILKNFRKISDLPLAAYPNSGEIYDRATGQWKSAPNRGSFSEMAKAWYADGAVMIGGCCRTRPADIREIAAWSRTL